MYRPYIHHVIENKQSLSFVTTSCICLTLDSQRNLLKIVNLCLFIYLKHNTPNFSRQGHHASSDRMLGFTSALKDPPTSVNEVIGSGTGSIFGLVFMG